jgi:tetratricopeptide (TPR) repeat protein
MRNIIPALMIPAVCFTLAADSTGRIAGKVTTKDGKPLPQAVITLSRTEITWTKEVKMDDKGTYMQVGLEPKDFKLTCTAPGYQTYKENIRIKLGDVLTVNIKMLTAQEAADEALKANLAALPAGEGKSMAASASFNAGVEFYNQQNFVEALPHVEKAVTGFKEALAEMKEGDTRKTVEGQIPTAERVYGITLYEVAKADPTQSANYAKAEPYLAAALQRNPKDQRVLVALVDVAKATNNEAALKTYQAALDTLMGPRPELAYNDGVAAFNAGKFKEAKAFVTKAIALDPKFADSYWLLGVVEFSLENIKGAKESFKKYMEIAPTGKKAGEVKEFLKELK